MQYTVELNQAMQSQVSSREHIYYKRNRLVKALYTSSHQCSSPHCRVQVNNADLWLLRGAGVCAPAAVGQ